jgi:hypothetical protein
MNNLELENKLKELNIPINEYSLNGDLISEAIILYKNYSIWEVFYLDEKGERNNEIKFYNEDEACKYIYKLFIDSKVIKEKYNIK